MFVVRLHEAFVASAEVVQIRSVIAGVLLVLAIGGLWWWVWHYDGPRKGR